MLITGSPARRLTSPITRCRDQPHSAMQGRRPGKGTDQTLDAKRLTLMSGYSPHCHGFRPATPAVEIAAQQTKILKRWLPHVPHRHARVWAPLDHEVRLPY
jgi:hypothetical protein